MNQFRFQPIGVVRSPYREKFGTPRQPGLVSAALGEITLLPPFNDPDCVRGLDSFSHLWVHFVFHACLESGWKPTVRPPRLGGNARVGVFASRSNFRPNPIGQSLVKLEEIAWPNNKPVLQISGFDLLDGTPVLDIKPYLPWADQAAPARSGYASSPPGPTLGVQFSPTANSQCADAPHPKGVDLHLLITQVLQQDPRPAYHRNRTDDRRYGIRLYDLNIEFLVHNNFVEVITIHPR